MFARDSRDCRSMNSSDSVLDPLHLPRAPILRHNVSLCHGRATPLFSPSTTPAASSVARSRVYGILDFGNSVVRIAHSWTQVAPVLHPGRKHTGEGGEGDGFSAYIFPFNHPPSSPRIHLFYAFSESTSGIHDATSDESWKYSLPLWYSRYFIRISTAVLRKREIHNSQW